MQNECIGLCGNLTQTRESAAELFHPCILGLSGNCATYVIMSLAFLPLGWGGLLPCISLLLVAQKGFVFQPFWSQSGHTFRSCSLLELQKLESVIRQFTTKIFIDYFLRVSLVACNPNLHAPVVQKVDSAIRWINLYPS